MGKTSAELVNDARSNNLDYISKKAQQEAYLRELEIKRLRYKKKSLDRKQNEDEQATNDSNLNTNSASLLTEKDNLKKLKKDRRSIRDSSKELHSKQTDLSNKKNSEKEELKQKHSKFLENESTIISSRSKIENNEKILLSNEEQIKSNNKFISNKERSKNKFSKNLSIKNNQLDKKISLKEIEDSNLSAEQDKLAEYKLQRINKSEEQASSPSGEPSSILKNEIFKLDQKIIKIETNIDKITQKCSSLEYEINRLNSDICSLNESIINLNEEIDYLASENENLEQQSSDLKLENIASSKEISELESENESLNEEISKLESSIPNLQSEIESLRHERSELHKKSSNLKASIETSKTTIETLQTEADNLNQSKTELSQTGSQLDTEISGLKTFLETATSKVTANELHQASESAKKASEAAIKSSASPDFAKKDHEILHSFFKFQEVNSNVILNTKLNGEQSSNTYVPENERLFIFPNDLSDREIFTHFKKIKDISSEDKFLELSYKWIEICPTFQQGRLREILDKITIDEDLDEASYSNDKTLYETTISSKTTLRKFDGDKFTDLEPLPVGAKVALTSNKFDYSNLKFDSKLNHHCVKVKYSKDPSNNTFVEGFVKISAIISTIPTSSFDSVLSSSQNSAMKTASATNHWYRPSAKRKIDTQQSSTNPFDFINDPSKIDNNKYPNPALMSDQDIYKQFSINISNPKYSDEWIDLYLLHKSRMEDILESLNKGKEEFEMSVEKPTGIYGVIKNSPHHKANIYKPKAGKLESFVYLTDGDLVLINKKRSSNPTANTQTTTFDFNYITAEGKQYVYINCISDNGTIDNFYVDSAYISFVVDSEADILAKTTNTKAKPLEISSTDNNADFNKLIEGDRLTSYLNPRTMSDKQILEYVCTLGDFDNIYAWSTKYPSETHRIQKLFNDNQKEGQSTLNSSDIDYSNVSDEKPSNIIASVKSDKAIIYLADSSGNNIKGTSEKPESPGYLKKGAKIRVALKYDASNKPYFLYHKIGAVNSKYVQIDYLDNNKQHKLGFIDSSQISIYEKDDFVDTIISIYDSGGASTESIIDNLEDSSEIPGSISDGLDFEYRKDTDKVKGIDMDSVEKTGGISGNVGTLISLGYSLKDVFSDKSMYDSIFSEKFLSLLFVEGSAVSDSIVSTVKAFGGDKYELTSNITSTVSSAMSIFKILRTTLPSVWKKIKGIDKEEASSDQDSATDIQSVIETANSACDIASNWSKKLFIPALASGFAIANTGLTTALDIYKFYQFTKQRNSMDDLSKTLSNPSNPSMDTRDKRESELGALDNSIKKLEFKGKGRSDTDKIELNNLKKKRSEYTDISTTEELKEITVKRRQRQGIKIGVDVLNLAGDISKFVSTIVPEPTSIATASLISLSCKGAAALLSSITSFWRAAKQKSRDSKPNDPNSTTNKQKRYAKIAGSILSNIANIPPANSPDFLKKINIVQSHIFAAGTSVSELSKYKDDPQEMFKTIYISLLYRG